MLGGAIRPDNQTIPVLDAVVPSVGIVASLSPRRRHYGPPVRFPPHAHLLARRSGNRAPGDHRRASRIPDRPATRRPDSSLRVRPQLTAPAHDALLPTPAPTPAPRVDSRYPTHDAGFGPRLPLPTHSSGPTAPNCAPAPAPAPGLGSRYPTHDAGFGLPGSPVLRFSGSPVPRLPDSPTPRLPDSPTPRLPDSPTPRLPDSPTPTSSHGSRHQLPVTTPDPDLGVGVGYRSTGQPATRSASRSPGPT